MKVWGYILLILLFTGAFFAGRWTKPCDEPNTVRRDTVFLRDTLNAPVLPPVSSEVIGADTCMLPVALPDEANSVPKNTADIQIASPLLAQCASSLLQSVDSLRVPVVVPIERKIYVTADYRAVIEGYKPKLVSMELYRQTQVVTNTVSAKPKRWGFGVHAGYGFIPTTKRFEPYIGVGVQYSIWQW